MNKITVYLNEQELDRGTFRIAVYFYTDTHLVEISNYYKGPRGGYQSQGYTGFAPAIWDSITKRVNELKEEFPLPAPVPEVTP